MEILIFIGMLVMMVLGVYAIATTNVTDDILRYWLDQSIKLIVVEISSTLMDL